MADLNPDNLLTSLQAMSPEDVNRLISTDTLQLSEVAKDQLRGAISVLQLSATGCSVMDCGACADAAECDSVSHRQENIDRFHSSAEHSLATEKNDLAKKIIKII